MNSAEKKKKKLDLKKLDLFKSDFANKIDLFENDLTKKIDQFKSENTKKLNQAFWCMLGVGIFTLIAIACAAAFIVDHIP